MRDVIVDVLPWILSVITAWMTLLAGDKNKNAWLVGLGNQALWLVWIVTSQSWGFLPMNALMWLVYFRNHVAWNAEDAADAEA